MYPLLRGRKGRGRPNVPGIALKLLGTGTNGKTEADQTSCLSWEAKQCQAPTAGFPWVLPPPLAYAVRAVLGHHQRGTASL